MMMSYFVGLKILSLRLINTQAEAILHFYKKLKPGFDLPAGVKIMNPFSDKTSWQLTEGFYRKFYSDTKPRIFIFGINPGRFGGGITGIPFTDPIRLQGRCGINNELRKLPELSSLFVYEMIDDYGGVQSFYNDFFITALSPLGFVKHGKNLNYYDDKNLLKACEPFISESIRKQLKTIPAGTTCFCLGEGENYKQFSRFNEQHHFFEKIIPLPHPRWIMQYRRKKMKEYIEMYVEKLKAEIWV